MKATIKTNKMFGNIDFHRYMDMNAYSLHLDMDKIMQDIGISIQNQINDAIMKELFTIYEHSNVSQVYVISEKEFKNYLNETLPKYLMAREENKEKTPTTIKEEIDKLCRSIQNTDDFYTKFSHLQLIKLALSHFLNRLKNEKEFENNIHKNFFDEDED